MEALKKDFYDNLYLASIVNFKPYSKERIELNTPLDKLTEALSNLICEEKGHVIAVKVRLTIPFNIVISYNGKIKDPEGYVKELFGHLYILSECNALSVKNHPSNVAISKIVHKRCESRIKQRIKQLQKKTTNQELLTMINDSLNVGSYVPISRYCNNLATTLEDGSPEKRKVMKVGSYHRDINFLIKLALEDKYKSFLKNVSVSVINPIEESIELSNLVGLIPYDDAEQVAQRLTNLKDSKANIDAIYGKLGYKFNLVKTQYLHAELALLIKPLSKEYSIGISKLCCLPCYRYIQYIKKKHSINIIVRGCHQKIYNNWMIPPNADQDFIKEIRNELVVIIKRSIPTVSKTSIKSDSSGGDVDDDETDFVADDILFG